MVVGPVFEGKYVVMSSRSKYSLEFRAEAVRAVLERSRPLATVALELGVNPETLRVWVNRAKSDTALELRGPEVVVDRERREMQRRIADLEMENAFLKKAAAFFAATQNQKNGLR